MIFVIADTHFYHPKLVNIGARPEDFTERILANWKRTVGPEDTVLHLGDVIIHGASRLPDLMCDLPGRKVLIVGNHDHSPTWYESRGFDFACDAILRDKLLFTHEPVWPLPHYVEFNIHGHFHSEDTPLREEYRRDPTSYYNTHRSRYILVSIEKSLSPIPLNQILGDHQKRIRSGGFLPEQLEARGDQHG